MKKNSDPLEITPFLRALAEETPLPVSFADAEGNLKFANSEFTRLVGVRTDQITGRSLNDLLDRLETVSGGAVGGLCDQQGRPVEDRMWLAAGDDGTWRVRRTVVRNESGETLGQILTILKDGDRRLEITPSKGKVSIGVRALRLIAHELRSPLASVRAVSQMLRDSLALPAEAIRMIDLIEEQSAKVSRFVNEVLDLLQIYQGTYPWRRSQLDLVALVNQRCRRLASAAAGRPVRVTWTLPSHPLILEGDTRALATAFDHVFSNALRCTEAGFVEVVMEHSETPMGAEATVEVRDTGSGIPPSVFDKLGRPFSVSHGFLEEDAVEGAGIGLALAFGILRAHRGRWSVDSHSRGTTLQVALPVLKPSEGVGAEKDA